MSSITDGCLFDSLLHNTASVQKNIVLLALGVVALSGCVGQEGLGLAPSHFADTTVKMDLFHRPLPEIPLPNDVATRFDATSPTGLRINASLVAPTQFEARVRELIDQLDGWGLNQSITIPFSGPLDVGSILAGHRDMDYDPSNDVVYLINIDRRSKDFGQLHHLDVGNGNFPLILEKLNLYGKNDPRGWTLSLLFEEEDEDLNGNGRLDPGEDTDADGVLDKPNYLPGMNPERDDLGGRADALMTFYERESHTLLLRPLLPLRERTTYAVVITRRLKDAQGRPVGSPYPYINHVSQTPSMEALPEVLPEGLDLSEVAFAFSFTTQSSTSQMVAVREGLYGHGVQAHLGNNYPPRVLELARLMDEAYYPDANNPFALHPERYLDVFEALGIQLFDLEPNTAFTAQTIVHHRYADFHVIGSFESPQLFRRRDAAGDLLPLHDQIWPPDLDRIVAEARPEPITFWLTVPRKEVSVRGQGKPAPVVILVPGYTSSWIEMLFFGAVLTKHGVAVICINAPSHGMEFDEIEEIIGRALARANGFESLFNALMLHRAFDQNGDGTVDSGADFLTAYMFHTRDIVRQTALDVMQLVRLLKSFDGKRRWSLDVNNDGSPELAGDFDGDGQVDVGGSAPLRMTGGSLGGILTLLVGSLEPEIRTIAPFSGGAGLADIGIRSRVEGIPESFLLRLMGPVFVGTLDKDSGLMELETIVPDLREQAILPIATLSDVRSGDTLVVDNLDTGARGCGYVSAEGTVRAQVESNEKDRIRITFYRGQVVVGSDCQLRPGSKPSVTVDTFEEDIVFQARIIKRGQPLVALAEGLGLSRATPALRRLIAFGSVVMDAADPMVFVRHLQTEPIHYDGTGQTTGAHALISTSVGDMAVPPSTGIAAARATGLIDFLRQDPRYGKPENQVLIDTFTYEGVHTLGRFTDTAGNPVHIDVDNLSQGQDRWRDTVPRLSPPLRIGVGTTDPLGGVSAAIFPYSDPEGMHIVPLPGEMTDDMRDACRDNCNEQNGEDPCDCNSLKPFDLGMYFFNVLGRYLRSNGQQLHLDTCNGFNTCSDIPEVPERRPEQDLP